MLALSVCPCPPTCCGRDAGTAGRRRRGARPTQLSLVEDDVVVVPVLVAALVEISEVDEEPKGNQERLHMRVLHRPELHLVVVDVVRDHELETIWDDLFQPADFCARLRVRDFEVHLATRAARTWAEQAPLAAVAA